MLEEQNAERRQGQGKGMIPPMGGYGGGSRPSKVSVPTAPIDRCIAVQNLAPEASLRDPYPVMISRNRREIADHEDPLSGVFPLSQETDNASLPIVKIHPLKAFSPKIQLVQRRFCSIEMVQIFDPSLHSLMRRI